MRRPMCTTLRSPSSSPVGIWSAGTRVRIESVEKGCQPEHAFRRSWDPLSRRLEQEIDVTGERIRRVRMRLPVQSRNRIDLDLIEGRLKLVTCHPRVERPVRNRVAVDVDEHAIWAAV